jgi:hypothetical protein
LAHFARIKDGIVDFVTVGRDDDENREDELPMTAGFINAPATTQVAVFTLTAAHPFARTTLALDIATTLSVMRLSHPSHTTHGC